MSLLSCRALPAEEDTVVKAHAAATGLSAYQPDVTERRLADSGFPSRDGRLADPADLGHLDLGDAEEFAANVLDCIHPYMDIHKGINNQPTNHAMDWICSYTEMYISRMEISHLIQRLLEVRGWTQEELANAVDTKQNNISRWLAGVEPRGKPRDRIMELARESGLIEEEVRSTVPIMGFIGAGAEIDPEFEQVPEDGIDQVELPFQYAGDVVGFLVRGDSMLPRYEEGTVIVVYREQTRSTISLVGEIAAVRTQDNRRYLKMLKAGGRPHTFNLESFNARPIENVRIVWASEVVGTVMPRHVRHIRRTKPAKVAKRGAAR